jgi:hypothetical protein
MIKPVMRLHRAPAVVTHYRQDFAISAPVFSPSRHRAIGANASR